MQRLSDMYEKHQGEGGAVAGQKRRGGGKREKLIASYQAAMRIRQKIKVRKKMKEATRESGGPGVGPFEEWRSRSRASRESGRPEGKENV
jgi:hypothetical protein